MIRSSKTGVFLLHLSGIGSRLLGMHDYALTAMSQYLPGINYTSAAVFLNVLGSYSGKFNGSVVGW